MSKGGETTQRHFKIFKAECLRLQKAWGLNEWDIIFEHCPLDGLMASCAYRANSRKACISLATTFGDSPVEMTDETIKKTARHEMVHLLLAPMALEGTSRYTSPDAFEGAEHAVLNKLLTIIKP